MIDAEDYASRAFPEAQRLLAGPSLPEIRRFIDMGWFDSDLSDRAAGSFALVREGAGLDALVGEVVYCRHGGPGQEKGVYVHVWDSVPEIPDDFVVSRRAFLYLALLSAETIPVLIEKVV